MLVLLCAIGSSLTGATPSPSPKSQKRIKEIEEDYGVKFVQTAVVSVQDKKTEYWCFLKLDPGCSFAGFPFAVPVGAIDKTVQQALASALCCSGFYEAFLKRMKSKASPSPSPTPEAYTPNGV